MPKIKKDAAARAMLREAIKCINALPTESLNERVWAVCNNVDRGNKHPHSVEVMGVVNSRMVLTAHQVGTGMDGELRLTWHSGDQERVMVKTADPAFAAQQLFMLARLVL